VSTREARTTVWVGIAGGLIAVAPVIAGIDGATHASNFDWTSLLMFGVYALIAAGLILLVGLLLEWPFLVGQSPTPPVELSNSIPVSDEHRTQLRDAAAEWSIEFGRLLEPDWALRPLENFDDLDSDDGLRALCAHFPKLRSDYAKWRTSNASLRGLPKDLNWIGGYSGFKPSTDEGTALLKQHNNLMRSLLTDLSEIRAQPIITGQCDQCATSR
jgi:hypothetical protein